MFRQIKSLFITVRQIWQFNGCINRAVRAGSAEAEAQCRVRNDECMEMMANQIAASEDVDEEEDPQTDGEVGDTDSDPQTDGEVGDADSDPNNQGEDGVIEGNETEAANSTNESAKRRKNNSGQQQRRRPQQKKNKYRFRKRPSGE